MPSWMCLNFQDSSSYFMKELFYFHDHAMMIMVGVMMFIFYFIIFTMKNSHNYKNFSESTLIEIIWSLLPVFLLVILIMPSMKILYIMEDVKSPLFTFKIIAHQWYWSYIVPLYKNYFFISKNKMFMNYEFDSMMEMDSIPRLLKCSNNLNIPINTTSRLLITSDDVIHSFSVPSMGLKVDAVPGRINQLFVNPTRLGEFYGQCSEICGSNHSFMPICMKIITINEYEKISKNHLLTMIEEEMSNN